MPSRRRRSCAACIARPRRFASRRLDAGAAGATAATMTQLQPRLGARDIAVAALMNLLWGMNIIAVKMAVIEIPPMTAALLRQAIVLLVCLSWLRIVPGRGRALIGFGVLTGGAYFVVINFSMAVASNVGALAIAGQLGVPFA